MFSLRNASETDRTAAIVVERYVSDFVQAKTKWEGRPVRESRQGDGGDGGERAVVCAMRDGVGSSEGGVRCVRDGLAPRSEDAGLGLHAPAPPRQAPDTPLPFVHPSSPH